MKYTIETYISAGASTRLQMQDWLRLAFENGVDGSFLIGAETPDGRRQITFEREFDATDPFMLKRFDNGMPLDRAAREVLADELWELGPGTLLTVVRALRDDRTLIHGLNPDTFEGRWRGINGRHDWCIGRKEGDEGFCVFVDDRQVGYRESLESARAHALDVVERLRADGDYRLNDKPAGFMPPLLEEGEQSLKRLSETEIDAVCNEALNDACLVIQKAIGQTDGGVAALHFAGFVDDEIRAQFRRYIEAEYAFEERGQNNSPRMKA